MPWTTFGSFLILGFMGGNWTHQSGHYPETPLGVSSLSLGREDPAREVCRAGLEITGVFFQAVLADIPGEIINRINHILPGLGVAHGLGQLEPGHILKADAPPADVLAVTLLAVVLGMDIDKVDRAGEAGEAFLAGDQLVGVGHNRALGVFERVVLLAGVLVSGDINVHQDRLNLADFFLFHVWFWLGKVTAPEIRRPASLSLTLLGHRPRATEHVFGQAGIEGDATTVVLKGRLRDLVLYPAIQGLDEAGGGAFAETLYELLDFAGLDVLRFTHGETWSHQSGPYPETDQLTPICFDLTLDIPAVELLVELGHLPSAVHEELLDFRVLIGTQLEIHQLPVVTDGGLIPLWGVEIPDERLIEHFPGFSGSQAFDYYVFHSRKVGPLRGLYRLASELELTDLEQVVAGPADRHPIGNELTADVRVLNLADAFGNQLEVDTGHFWYFSHGGKGISSVRA